MPHDQVDGDNSTGTLVGLRVLEVGHLIAGPFCGHLFADHGAEVVKIEPPGVGDPMRQWGGVYRGVGLYWSVIGRGKKSVTLDLRKKSDQAAFLRLVATADVLIENLRPGTMERWGIGWETLHALNARLIMVRISGYGQTGPYAKRSGFALIAEGMSGFRHLSAEPDRPSIRVGISLGDSLAGTQGFTGALMALWRRDSPYGSGTGQMVDVALYESMWMHMESMAAEYQKLGVVRQPHGSSLPGIAPSNAYPTKDNSWVLIGANHDAVFFRLAEAVARPDWIAAGSQFLDHVSRGRHQVELDSEIANWTRSRSKEEIMNHLTDYGVPVGTVFTAADIVDNEHYLAREMLLNVAEPNLDGETVLHPGIVPKLSGDPGKVRRGAPLLGEHNDEFSESLVEPI